jgi:hypothetical protein
MQTPNHIPFVVESQVELLNSPESFQLFVGILHNDLDQSANLGPRRPLSDPSHWRFFRFLLFVLGSIFDGSPVRRRWNRNSFLMEERVFPVLWVLRFLFNSCSVIDGQVVLRFLLGGLAFGSHRKSTY